MVVRHPLLWVFLLLLLSCDKISDVDIHHLYTQICGKDIIIKKTTFEGLKWYFTQKSLNLCFNFILKQNHQIYKYAFIWRNNSFENAYDLNEVLNDTNNTKWMFQMSVFLYWEGSCIPRLIYQRWLLYLWLICASYFALSIHLMIKWFTWRQKPTEVKALKLAKRVLTVEPVLLEVFSCAFVDFLNCKYISVDLHKAIGAHYESSCNFTNSDRWLLVLMWEQMIKEILL